MKYRSRPFVCALGLAALLSSCAPTTAPATSSPAPAGSTTAPTPMASTSPAASTSPVASTPIPGGSATPYQGANGNVPVIQGVSVTVVKPGEGDALAKGQVGKFHYTGWLERFDNATSFDSSRDRDPLSFQVGSGQVIPGWDQGLIGMQPGEIRRLEIAPEMAYGADGRPPGIPPNSTLFFEVEYMGPGQ